MVQTQGPDDALNSSKGKRLEVDSLVANAASVGCNLCALPSPIDIDDIVVQLGSHDVANSLRVVSDLRKSVKLNQFMNAGTQAWIHNRSDAGFAAGIKTRTLPWAINQGGHIAWFTIRPVDRFPK